MPLPGSFSPHGNVTFSSRREKSRAPYHRPNSPRREVACGKLNDEKQADAKPQRVKNQRKYAKIMKILQARLSAQRRP